MSEWSSNVIMAHCCFEYSWTLPLIIQRGSKLSSVRSASDTLIQKDLLVDGMSVCRDVSIGMDLSRSVWMNMLIC